MEPIPLKKLKNACILWTHARKVFHEDGSVKHIVCNHCGKTYAGASRYNSLNHLYRFHFNHLIPIME